MKITKYLALQQLGPLLDGLVNEHFILTHDLHQLRLLITPELFRHILVLRTLDDGFVLLFRDF